MNTNNHQRPTNIWVLREGKIEWEPYLSIEERRKKGIPLIPRVIIGTRWKYQGQQFEVTQADASGGALEPVNYFV